LCLTYKDIVSHVSTRWLSLEKAINRILELYTSLESYFKSTSEPQARFKRLQEKFSNPITEVYLLFLQSIMPLFTRFNQLLQREDPMIHVLYSQMRKFLKGIMCRFIKPSVIKDIRDVTEIDYTDRNNHLDNDKVHIGLITRSKLRKLLDEGYISVSAQNRFLQGAIAFYESAVTYAIANLPFVDDLLKHAQFVDIKRRLDSSFTELAYFVERFPDLLPYSNLKDQELLCTQFTEFQTMQDALIPPHVWDEAKVHEKQDSSGNEVIEYHRMDILWSYLENIKDTVTGQPCFFIIDEGSKVGANPSTLKRR